MALYTVQFESQYLKCNTDITVIMPDKKRGLTPEEFYRSGEKYKVLWLLHGTYGDHSDWIRKTGIELYACEKDLIVVMPSVMNSNYANWDNFGIGYSAYDYLFEELMPLIYGWFPASDKREDNYIAGLSMGGRGTCVYAFNHPEKFAAAAILSASPRDTEWVLANASESMKKRTEGMIANRGGFDAYQASYENTWDILDKLVAEKADLPRLYFAIGSEDEIVYDAFVRFREHAKEIGLAAEFEEIEGYKHEWRFWDITIQHALEFFGLEKEGRGNAY